METLESRVVPAGSWTKLANVAPSSSNGIGVMMLVSDGTVLAEGGGTANTWYRLAPDASGSYVNGTWTALASMHHTRLYFGSNVLPDGRVYVGGGEYSDAGSETNTAEIYDPVANTWTNIANFPQSRLGDDPSEVLPNGTILSGFNGGTQTYIYNPANNQWTATGSKMSNDSSSEETWVKLPSNNILSYNICVFDPSGCTRGNAQQYVPASGTWAAAGTAPNNLSSSGVGYEMGPALRVPDGRIIQFGATGHTAIYTPSSNSWVAGTDIPSSLGADDAPGAIMPNGHILVAADHPTFGAPTKIFEFDPTASSNPYTDVTPPSSIINTGGPAYTSRMLVLPTGQVLLTTGNSQLAIWTPTGSPDPSWKPTIAGVTNNGDGSYTLSGTQLNGLSEGASYGDDAEMSSNYPIVQFKDASNHVYYARTFSWSSTGIATGSTTVTTKFKPPANLPGGTFTLTVIANGIASAGFTFTNVAVSHFGVTAGNLTPTAGTAFTVTVRALDTNNNVVTGYRGTVHFTSSDGQASLPANYTFTAADNGMHTFNVTLKTAGNQTVTATDTAISSATGQAAVTVNPAAASQFWVGTTASDPVVAGTAFDVAVLAMDPYGNVATNYQGTIAFSSADPYGAALPANYTFQTTDYGFIYLPAAAALYTAGTWDVTATDVSSQITGTASVNVRAAPAVYLAVAAPASIASGTAFDVTVSALDPYGNVDTNYRGTVTWLATDPSQGVVLPADYAFQPGDQGVVTYAGGVTLVTPGDQVIYAIDNAANIGGGAEVTVTSAGPQVSDPAKLAALAIAPVTAGRASVPTQSSATAGALATASTSQHWGVDRFFTLAGNDAGLVRPGQEAHTAAHLALEAGRGIPDWELGAVGLPLE